MLPELQDSGMVAGGNRRPGALAMQIADDVASAALSLRLKGMSYPEIARQIGYTTEGARKAVIRGMEEARTERAETAIEVREQEAARLDRMLQTLERMAEATEDPSTLLAIQDRLLKIQDRRARLLGLDLQRLEVTGAHGGPIQIAQIQRVIVDSPATITATVVEQPMPALEQSIGEQDKLYKHEDNTINADG